MNKSAKVLVTIGIVAVFIILFAVLVGVRESEGHSTDHNYKDEDLNIRMRTINIKILRNFMRVLNTSYTNWIDTIP